MFGVGRKDVTPPLTGTTLQNLSQWCEVQHISSCPLHPPSSPPHYQHSLCLQLEALKQQNSKYQEELSVSKERSSSENQRIGLLCKEMWVQLLTDVCFPVAPHTPSFKVTHNKHTHTLMGGGAGGLFYFYPPAGSVPRLLIPVCTHWSCTELLECGAVVAPLVSTEMLFPCKHTVKGPAKPVISQRVL